MPQPYVNFDDVTVELNALNGQVCVRWRFEKAECVEMYLDAPELDDVQRFIIRIGNELP